LLKETIEQLNPRDNGIYVDATFGRGGHTKELLSHINNSHVYAFDRDETAIEAGEKLKNSDAIGNNQLTLIRSNFENMKESLNKLNVTAVDGVVYDLGVSSPQFD